MSNTYRTLSQHLNDLKKENFSLKLRIYFLEERFQQKFEDSSSEDVHRRVSVTRLLLRCWRKQLIFATNYEPVINLKANLLPENAHF